MSWWERQFRRKYIYKVDTFFYHVGIWRIGRHWHFWRHYDE